MFNQPILQLIPALFAMCRLLVEHLQLHQIGSIDLVQCIEVDQLFAQEKLQQFLVHGNILKHLVLVEIIHQVDLLIVERSQNAIQHSIGERLFALVSVTGDVLRLDDGEIIARCSQVRLILVEEDLKMSKMC